MALWQLPLRSLWRALGVEETREPQVEPRVTLTYAVGDGSALVGPLVPPMAMAGALVSAAAGQHPAIEVRSRAPGGTLIRKLSATTGVVANWRWGLRSAAAPGLVLRTNHNQGPDPVLAEVRVGLVNPALLTAGDPVEGAPSFTTVMVDDVYVPQGARFYMETSAPVGAGVVGVFSAFVQDFPEPPPAL